MDLARVSMRTGDPDDPLNILTGEIVDAALEVHRHLKAGLKEIHYKDALEHELSLRGLKTTRELHVPITYKGKRLSRPGVLDFLVAEKVIVEAKSVETLHAAHDSQVIGYLAMTRLPVGLLINFNAPHLGGQIRRFVGPA